MGDGAEDRRQLAGRLADSKKYRDVAPAVLERIAGWALDASRSTKEAEKTAKRKLHQIYGAYIEGGLHTTLDETIAAIPADASNEVLKTSVYPILARHASTRERADDLDGFFAGIFDAVGQPRRIVDLGCGVNPLAIPWMPLGADTVYTAVDLDGRAVGSLDPYFGIAGVRGRGVAADLLAYTPEETVDLAFAFKLLPVLEQQAPGASRELLCRLPADTVAVTFPRQTLGGRSKNLAETYANFMKTLLTKTPYSVIFEQNRPELLYVLQRTENEV